MQWENNDGSLRASVDRKAYVYSIRVFSRTFFFRGCYMLSRSITKIMSISAEFCLQKFNKCKVSHRPLSFTLCIMGCRTSIR